jgi:tripartite ATP-independent transporter DctP family solute receptor
VSTRFQNRPITRRDVLKMGAAAGAAAAVAPTVLSGRARAQAPEVTLVYANAQAAGTSQGQGFAEFERLVEEMSDGRIAVDVFYNGELAGLPALIDQTRAGAVSMTIATPSWFAETLPKIAAFSLPYLFTSREQALSVIDSGALRKVADDLQSVGLVTLGFPDLGFRHVVNKLRPVAVPADLDGMKLRTQNNPAHIRAFEALGANPVAMDFAELYSALETGVVDGFENALGEIIPNNLHEVTHYVSETSHAYEVFLKVMNKDQFDSLPADLRDIVVEASDQEIAFQRAKLLEVEESAAADLMAAGMELNEIPEDVLEEFAAIVRPTYAQSADAIGQELLDELLAAVS